MPRYRLRLTAAFIALVTLGPGCSGGDAPDNDGGQGSGGSAGDPNGGGSGFLGSCDTRSVTGPSIGQCRDWNGNANADLSVSCDGLEGVFSIAEPCPAESRAGSCTLEPVLGISATYNYYEPEYSVAEAQDHCRGLEGTFDSG